MDKALRLTATYILLPIITSAIVAVGAYVNIPRVRRSS